MESVKDVDDDDDEVGDGPLARANGCPLSSEGRIIKNDPATVIDVLVPPSSLIE